MKGTHGSEDLHAYYPSHLLRELLDSADRTDPVRHSQQHSTDAGYGTPVIVAVILNALRTAGRP